MHEISLGYTLQDYLTGESVEATTYEDIRQAIVQMMVERRGYPKEHITTKQKITFLIEGKEYSQSLDILVKDDQGKSLLAVQFCAGEVETYTRQTLAAARLIPNSPAKLALVTDTKKAMLLRVYDGEMLDESGYHSFPSWKDLQTLASELPEYKLDTQKATKEQRLLYAFSELSCSCSTDTCSLT